MGKWNNINLHLETFAERGERNSYGYTWSAKVIAISTSIMGNSMSWSFNKNINHYVQQQFKSRQFYITCISLLVLYNTTRVLKDCEYEGRPHGLTGLEPAVSVCQDHLVATTFTCTPCCRLKTCLGNEKSRL